MYKVFVDNTPIILSTDSTYGADHRSLPIKEVDMEKIIHQILSGEATKIHLYHKTEEKLFKHLQKKLPVVIAGGGKVFNAKNEILFIRRNGKWDLPKGKAEKKETIALTALREVEEETGVTGLEIIKFIRKTYHIFKRQGEYRLKITYWFEMKTDFGGVLVPQKNEGIDRVCWKNYKKTKKALGKSYANIRLLFSKDFYPKKV